MSLSLKRPADLPDFDTPPLDEVVLGVQFDVLSGYRKIQCGEVWGLYRDGYPKVEERLPLPPSFEIFGGHAPLDSIGQLNLSDGPIHERFWFLDSTGNQIIQFQPDRLLHNWRKVDGSDTYPRFESMANAFNTELARLEGYANTLESQSLSINQCEVSYINRIAIESESERKLANWVALWADRQEEPENVGFSLRYVLRRDNGVPYARLFIDCGTGIDNAGKPVFGLTLSIRGAPLEPTIDSAMRFLAEGRNVIVNKFREITTPFAHKKWGIKNA